MQLTVTGKQVDVGEALRRHVEASLDSLLGKYFRTAIEAHAVFTREAHLIRTDLSLHIGRGIIVKSGAAATDYYPAFDAAAERPETARSFVLAPVDEADDEGEAAARVDGEAAAPIVIAEMSTDLPSLTVGEAVMRLDRSRTGHQPNAPARRAFSSRRLRGIEPRWKSANCSPRAASSPSCG